MFLSKEAEILSKALNIRRLSFLTFWGNYDVFRVHLPSLQEKLVDLTKYYNGFILGEVNTKKCTLSFLSACFRFSS